MTVLYNENEPYVAQWLRNLSAANHIAPGAVDDRSIKELDAADLDGVTQFHAFAGIGAWSYALRLAKWPDDIEVWTGSCPCQPFSTAGKGQGIDDPRHLWPEWYRLIEQCRPTIIFGEQVASPGGRAWLEVVQIDLEALGYIFAAADLCAAGVGAPHIRQRLFFGAHIVGHTDGEGLARRSRQSRHDGPQFKTPERTSGESTARELANADSERRQRERIQLRERAERPSLFEDARRGETRPWASATWLDCADGKARPVEPGTFPLAYGATGRVGRLRAGVNPRVGKLKAYGNAIVPQIAAAFICSFKRACNEKL